jgi:DNA-binding MarR family transcriptional regulator
MKDDIIDSIDEDLFQAFHLIRKKFLRIEHEGALKDISRHHMDIMGMLYQSGILPVSEIGRRLLISRSQMTHLIDKLIRLGMVERLPDKADRRIINIKLTGGGKIALRETRGRIRENIRRKLSCLKDDELEALSISLRKLRDVTSKLD